jgi:hypothetical protein
MENKKITIVIVIIVLVLILSGVGTYFLRHNKSETKIPTQSTEEVTKITEGKPYENPPAIPVTETLTENTLESPVLTQKQAETLVTGAWGECTPDSCAGPVTVTLEYTKGWNIVHAVYNNLFDDSTLAQKIEAKVLYQDKKWALDEPTISWSCRKDRGHQDFSTVNCK